MGCCSSAVAGHSENGGSGMCPLSFSDCRVGAVVSGRDLAGI